MKRKTLISVMAIAITLCCLIGTTYAWLVAKTEPVANTFTFGNITLSLSKSESNSTNTKIVPGQRLTEDPTVTVKKDSEACWLFIKIEETANFDTFLSYNIATDWKLLEENDQEGYTVYYREVEASSVDKSFRIIEDGELVANITATKADYDAVLAEEDYPKLTFTAYAVQRLGFDTAAAAWAEAKDLTQSGGIK